MLKQIVSYWLCISAMLTSIVVLADETEQAPSGESDFTPTIPNESLNDYLAKQSKIRPIDTINGVSPDVKHESVDGYYQRNGMKLYKPRLKVDLGDHRFKYRVNEDLLSYEYKLAPKTNLLYQYRGHEDNANVFLYQFKFD